MSGGKEGESRPEYARGFALQGMRADLERWDYEKIAREIGRNGGVKGITRSEEESSTISLTVEAQCYRAVRTLSNLIDDVNFSNVVPEVLFALACSELRREDLRRIAQSYQPGKNNQFLRVV